MFDQRINTKFCVKLRESARNTFKILRTIYDEAAMKKSAVFEWYKRLKKKGRRER